MNNKSFKNWAVVMALCAATPTMLAAGTSGELEVPQAQAQAQKGTATGVVVDSEGEPMAGATIRVEGTSLAAAADIDGNFSLNNVPMGAKLIITYVGYQPVTVTWNGQPLTITMADDSALLEEVVVLGYGITQKRTNVTNSVAKVSDEVLTVGTNANPAQALVGAVSGVKVAITSGAPGATPNITVRGGTNYSGGWNAANNAPLIIVDGQIRDNLSDINPNDIESMDILKDAGATALYGARAGNGVVIITTKHGKVGEGKVTFGMKIGVNSYMDTGYDMLGSKDFLYYWRTGSVNSGYGWTGTLGNSNGNTGYSNLWSQTVPGGAGRTTWNSSDPNVYYRIAQYNENTKYLVEQHGWSMMEDPVSDLTLIFKDTDIIKNNFNHPAITQDYNLSFSGGNDRGNYYASLGYYNADGASKGTYYTRYNFAFTGEYRLTKWLTSNSSLTYQRSNYLAEPVLGSGTGYISLRGRFWNNARFETEDGTQLYGNAANGNVNLNIPFNQKAFERNNQTDKWQMTQALTITILPELFIKGSMSWFYSEGTSDNFNRAYVNTNVGAMNPDGTSGVIRTYSTSNSFWRQWNQTYNVVANYSKLFAEKHQVNVVLGAELYKRYYWGFSADGSGAPAPFQDLELTSQDSRGMDSYHYKEAMISYFGRAEYNYMERYLLAATFRTDGYSRLINNRWGTFPGVSAGWVFTNEEFWKENSSLSWLNYGKLRGSFGYNATINSSYLGYYSLWGAYDAYQYNGSIGYRLTTLPNQNLKWEKTRTGEVGLTLGFLQNRINLDLTYYNRLTMDKYGNQNLPQTTGFSSYVANVGQFQNQGVEIDISATPIRTKDFSWTIGANISYNANKIIKLAPNGLQNNMVGATEVYYPNQNGGKETHYIGGQQEGQSPFQIVGYGTYKFVRSWAEVEALGDFIDIAHYTGGNAVYATEAGRQRLLDMGYSRTNIKQILPGSWVYEDINGDNMVDTYDRKILGNRDPHWTGGFNTTLSWKGLSLYARFDMGFGFKVYDSNISFLNGEGQGNMGFTKEMLDSWKADNPNGKYGRSQWADQFGTGSYIKSASRNNDSGTEQWMQNGNYLACRELSLSYQLPRQITEKFKCQGLTVSITGQNLGYIKSCTLPLPDYTFEFGSNTAGNGGTYNLPRTVIFGLNVSF